MSRQLALALALVFATLAPAMSHAGTPITFVGCPAGQAIRGIDFVNRTIVCAPVGGDTTALEARIAALEGALATARTTIACMHMEGTTELVVEGCNVHVRSGAGTTLAANGLGNLIIGYNEVAGGEVRTGSHNLVVGRYHTYSSFGGFVAGEGNSVTERGASVLGGNANTASGLVASVGGGVGNTASGTGASVSGGDINTASGLVASVGGGENNTASGRAASVSGGNFNTASGSLASVSGGHDRSATGDDDWVAGSLFEDF